jgi:N-acetylmuramoyl-L-alanine amidase
MALGRRAWLRLGIGTALAGGGLTDLAPAQARSRRAVRQHAGHAPDPAPAASLPLVTIDPGHGGKDPGCIGHRGVMEKQVMLALGLALRRQLLALRQCRVAMTRSSDVFVPLEERVRFAQRHRSAAMISLHANAAADPSACGANVYRFAYRASDPLAAAVERVENSANGFETGAPGHMQTPVLDILGSLMRRETMLHSALLQRDLVAGLEADWHLCGGGSRHARFAVLSAPDLASVLVETGFLTNRSDAAALSQPAHQVALARSIGTAVEEFLARLPEVRQGSKRD